MTDERKIITNALNGICAEEILRRAALAIAQYSLLEVMAIRFSGAQRNDVLLDVLADQAQIHVPK